MNYFNKKNVLIGALLLVVLIGGIIYFKLNSGYEEVVNNENTLLSEIEKNEKEEKTSGKVKVEVKGEVVTPGVYELDEDARLQDLVNAAGGFKDSAYYDNINLSKKIKDEMVLFVYSKTTLNKATTSKKKTTNNENTSKTTAENNNASASKTPSTSEKTSDECVVADYKLDKCIQNSESVIVVDDKTSNENESKTDSTSAKTSDTNTSTSSSVNKETSDNAANILVNINTADIKELTTLTGIGEAKAQKIIDYRNANGLFKSIEDITKVSGIGKATYEKFKANITI